MITHYVLIGVRADHIETARRLERAVKTEDGPDDIPPERGEDPRTAGVDDAFFGDPNYRNATLHTETWYVRGEWIEDSVRSEVLRFYGGGHIPADALFISASAVNLRNPLAAVKALVNFMKTTKGLERIPVPIPAPRVRDRVAGLFGRTGRFFRDIVRRA